MQSNFNGNLVSNIFWYKWIKGQINRDFEFVTPWNKLTAALRTNIQPKSYGEGEFSWLILTVTVCWSQLNYYVQKLKYADSFPFSYISLIQNWLFDDCELEKKLKLNFRNLCVSTLKHFLQVSRQVMIKPAEAAILLETTASNTVPGRYDMSCDHLTNAPPFVALLPLTWFSVDDVKIFIVDSRLSCHEWTKAFIRWKM